MLFFKIYEEIKRVGRNWETKKENELFYHRVKKSDGIIGVGTKLGHGVTISGLDKLALGKNVYIGSNCFIRADGGLIIGDNTTLSRNIVLYTINHDYTGERLPYDHSTIEDPVTIEQNVWIGMNATIAPGSTIGEGAVIGLGCRVFGEIPPLSIVGSPDWKLIKERDPEHYERLVNVGAYADDDGLPVDY